jgi:hypothetical protein
MTTFKARIRVGFFANIYRIDAVDVTLPEFPGFRFMAGPHYSLIEEVEEDMVAIYEFSSGRLIGYGSTLDEAKENAVSVINDHGGAAAIKPAIKKRGVLNRVRTLDRIITKVDSSRGAPMGRSGETNPVPRSKRVFDCAVPLDSGGYDRGGAYWGHGFGKRQLRVRYTKDLTFVEFYWKELWR